MAQSKPPTSSGSTTAGTRSLPSRQSRLASRLASSQQQQQQHPPTQVYTMGTHGKVKTRPHNVLRGSHQQPQVLTTPPRARSLSRDRHETRQQQASRRINNPSYSSKRGHERVSVHASSNKSVGSSDQTAVSNNRSHPLSSVEDHSSTHSAMHAGGSQKSDASSRSSSHTSLKKRSTSSVHSLSVSFDRQAHNMADWQERHKQHVRTTRRIVDGMFVLLLDIFRGT